VLLVDTNIWLAAGDRRSAHHEGCARLLADHTGELAAPVPVIAETAWLLLDRGGPAAQSAFLALVTTGRLDVVDLRAADWDRVLELVESYADLALDIIDASLVAVAERLDQRTIATLNHRDFAVVRPAHRDAFELVP
jgi:predicted nucleic acid-binding protein